MNNNNNKRDKKKEKSEQKEKKDEKEGRVDEGRPIFRRLLTLNAFFMNVL